MITSKLSAAALAAALLAAPAVGTAQDKPGEMKIPGTNTTLKLNGFVEVDATYDFDGSDDDIRANDWATFLPFQPLDDGEVDEFNKNLYVTARTSRVGLTLTTPTKGSPIVVRVEGDFNSPSPFNYSTEATTNGVGFRMRHAYGQWGGFLVGQTWSNFMDLGSLPDTVDFNPHGAFALTRQVGVRYTANVGKGSLAIALENPQTVVPNSTPPVSFTVGRRFDRLPDVSANFTMPLPFGHINVRGVAQEYHARQQLFDNTDPANPVLISDFSDSKWGYGAGVSGSVNFAGDSLVWSVQGGDGIGKYMFTSLFQGAEFVGDELETWKVIAYHVGFTHNWSPALRSNVIWTQTWFDQDDDLAAAGVASAFGDGVANRQIDAAFVNTFWSPTKGVDVGLEYAYGKRKLWASTGGGEGTQQRVNALVRYSFF